MIKKKECEGERCGEMWSWCSFDPMMEIIFLNCILFEKALAPRTFGSHPIHEASWCFVFGGHLGAKVL